MCGILGITGSQHTDIPDAAIQDGLDSLRHRGPDGAHFIRMANTTLGQTRLAIIDLVTGDQPMTDCENGNVIAFNGEIYNYQKLRTELEKKGHIFTTHSDTEVILKAYAEYGTECVTQLDGMFAFALWDAKTGITFLARDRFGKKPLYYAQDMNGNWCFASEIKALKALGIVCKLDPVAIDSYLALMYVPPWRSIYSNVHTVFPAHYAIIEHGNFSTSRYWELPNFPLSISYEEAKRETKRLLTEAVRKRVDAADVEVGSFLSGGVDSTLVTAYATEFVKEPIKTFSVGYGDHINELPFAREASEKIGTDHFELQTNVDMLEEFEKVISYFDEPHADSSNLAQHLVSKLAGGKVKVALSGDGADELFLGYGWYWKFWNTRKITRIFKTIFSNPFAEHQKIITFTNAKDRRALWKVAPKPERTDRFVQDVSNNGITKINLYDLTTYLPGQLLLKVDRAGMMHSLEVRSPFLDHELAEFVYSLPQKYKTDLHQGKMLLKDILSEIMPHEFVYRRKQGFGAPVLKWLREPIFEAYLRNELEKPEAPLYSFLKYDAVQERIRRFYSGNDQDFYQLWILLTLAVWLRVHHPEL